MCGSIAAAATSGALVGMGRRLGAPGAAFAAIGALFVRGGDVPPAIVAGVIMHVVASVLWTFVFLRLVAKFQGRIERSAILVAAMQLVVSWVIARLSGRGIATVVPFGDRVVLALCLAISLVVGMRFAFSPLRNA